MGPLPKSLTLVSASLFRFQALESPMELLVKRVSTKLLKELTFNGCLKTIRPDVDQTPEIIQGLAPFEQGCFEHAAGW